MCFSPVKYTDKRAALIEEVNGYKKSKKIE